MNNPLSSQKTISKAETIKNTYVDGFDSNPNEFLKFINNPIPIAVVSSVEEDGCYYPRAFLSAPSGVLFGGYKLTSQGLTEKENEQFSKLLSETGVNEKTSIHLKDEKGNICKTVNLRKAVVVATVSPGKTSYSIEKALWQLEINTIIELGDFKSPEHIVLTAGSYVLTFKDELSRTRAIQGFSEHYKDSYKIASEFLRRAIKEGISNA